jgi:glutathione S-transferase
MRICSMTPQVSAFRSVPAFAQGFVRDLRVRWALEEAGMPYEAVLVDQQITTSADYRSWQPFGQVPAYRDGDLEIFESGAIVLYLARRSDILAPRDEPGFARVVTWVIAALNSVEPAVANLGGLDVFYAGQTWTEGYRPVAEAKLRRRLDSLSVWLHGRDYLESRFTAADLVMTTVIREVAPKLLQDYPTLDAYRRSGEARPAFARALEAQMQPFRETAAA